MSDDQRGGAALIAGSLGAVVSMALHPSGHDLFAPGQHARAAHLAVGAHSLALASLALSFLGALALSRRLASPDRLALAALVTYALAGVAAMVAAVASGLVGPSVAGSVVAAGPSAAEAWRIVFDYNHRLNQAFARVFVVGSSTAIALWSASILRGATLHRGLGVYGCLLGPVIVLATLSGHLTLGVHGFGLVVLGQAAWFVTAGIHLTRRSRPHENRNIPASS